MGEAMNCTLASDTERRSVVRDAIDQGAGEGGGALRSFGDGSLRFRSLSEPDEQPVREPVHHRHHEHNQRRCQRTR